MYEMEQYAMSPFLNDHSGMRFNLPQIVTLYNEVYCGQDLFLVQWNSQLKIVEVIEACESDGFVFLTVKNQFDGEIIELSCPLDLKPEDTINWIVVSVAYLIELVIERMKQKFK